MAAGHQVNLEDQAVLAGWPTCSARDWKDSPGMATTGTNPDGSERTRLDQLPRVAALAIKGWATPRAEDGRGVADTLSAQVGQDLAGWTTPQADALGVISTSSPAGTESTAESRGALNPMFSLWLMGFPMTWMRAGVKAMAQFSRSRKASKAAPASSAEQATPSFPPSPRTSSRPAKKQ